jgi:hypothetical protein
MRILLMVWAAIIPFQTIGQYVWGKYISLAYVGAALLAFVLILSLAGAPRRVHGRHAQPLLPLILFLLIAALGLWLSPYPEARAKGLIQIGGLLVMLLVVVAMVSEVESQPKLFFALIRITMIVLGALALVGIVQFIVNNIHRASPLMYFEFLNRMAGGAVWNVPGKIGEIHRAGSWAGEPAHFTRFLGMGAGLGLIRVGFLGKGPAQSLRDTVPLWTAWSMLAGIVISISLLGWLLLFFIAGTLVLIATGHIRRTYGFRYRHFAGVFSGVVLLIVLIGGQQFRNKIASVSLLFRPLTIQTETLNGQSISALTLAVNMEVAKRNFASNPLVGGGIGSHRFAFQSYAPPFTREAPIFRLNDEDAASLALRLLSETGLAGFGLFVFGILFLAWNALRALMRANAWEMGDSRVWTSVGIVASGIAVFLIYLLRNGLYFDPMFWFLMDLMVAVPVTLNEPR